MLRSTILILVGVAAGTLLGGVVVSSRESPHTYRAKIHWLEEQWGVEQVLRKQERAELEQAPETTRREAASSAQAADEHRRRSELAITEKTLMEAAAGIWEQRAAKANVALALVVIEQGERPIRDAIVGRIERLGPWCFTGDALRELGIDWLLHDEMGFDRDSYSKLAADLESLATRTASD